MKTTAGSHDAYTSEGPHVDAKAVARIFGITLKSLAEILRVPPAHLRENRRRSPTVQVALTQLWNAHDALSSIFPETHIVKWLQRPNRGLGMAPIAYLHLHGANEFDGLVERMLDGGYF